jgi:hypothetical protein
MRVPRGPSNAPQSLRSGVNTIKITTKPAVKSRGLHKRYKHPKGCRGKLRQLHGVSDSTVWRSRYGSGRQHWEAKRVWEAGGTQRCRKQPVSVFYTVNNACLAYHVAPRRCQGHLKVGFEKGAFVKSRQLRGQTVAASVHLP